MLAQLRHVCVLNMYVQSSSAYIFDIVNTCLSVPTIVIGAVMSVSIFSTDSPSAKLASGILAITSTALSSVSKQLSPGERAQQHCFVVKEYHSLIRSIDVNTSLDKHDPREREIFIRDVQAELDRLYLVQPEPSFLATRIFERKYARNIESALYPEIEKFAANVVGRNARGGALSALPLAPAPPPRLSAGVLNLPPLGSPPPTMTTATQHVQVPSPSPSNSVEASDSVSTTLPPMSPMARQAAWNIGNVVVGYGSTAGRKSVTISRSSVPNASSRSSLPTPHATPEVPARARLPGGEPGFPSPAAPDAKPGAGNGPPAFERDSEVNFWNNVLSTVNGRRSMSEERGSPSASPR